MAMLGVVSYHDSIYAGTPHTIAVKDFDTAQVSPKGRMAKASDYSGRGINIGMTDGTYGPDESHKHLSALSGATQPEPVVLNTIGYGGTHGVHVARIIVGKKIDDKYDHGIAPNSRLYASNDTIMYEGMSVLADFNMCGVSTINNSWEFLLSHKLDQFAQVGGYKKVATSEAPGIRGYRFAVQSYGQLFVWAAGNGALSDVAWPAKYPLAAPDLETGWLVVVSIWPDGTLRAPSNACGKAANWCLAAVEGKAGGWRGTSFAAPVVTGVAALVSEAFPWMDSHGIRQTLLSTADNMGSPELFGWGRVNADRAVRGPALFVSTLTFGQPFVANFNRYRSEFSNDIGGDQGLIKQGSGTLVLRGNNTYTGSTQVLGGSLELYGRVAGNVIVGPHGTLYSDGGTVGGDLETAGTLRLFGNGLRVQGNFASTEAGADVQAQLGTELIIEGAARLNGMHWHIVMPTSTYVWQIIQPLLQAREIVGKLTEVEMYGLFKPSVVYTANQVSVLLERVKIDDVVRQLGGPSSRGVIATAVETAFTAIDHGLQGMPVSVNEEFIVEAAKLQHSAPASAFATALDSLTGEAYASSQALSFQYAQLVNRMLSHRVDALSLAKEDEGLWVNMLGASGKIQQHDFTSAETRLYGAQLGADHRWNKHAIIGAAFSWSDGNATFNGLGGRSQGQSRGLSLYGRYGGATGAYLAGRLGHDWITTEVSRNIIIGTARPINSARHDGMTSGYVELGRVVPFGQATYSAYLGAEYNQLRRGAFREEGSTFALRAASTTYRQGALSLGMRYQSEPITWAGGVTSMTAAGAYRYANPAALDFTAAFNGAPDASFRLRGIGLARHSGWLSIGVSTRLPDRNLSWFVNVDQQLNGPGSKSHAVSAGLRYEFG